MPLDLTGLGFPSGGVQKESFVETPKVVETPTDIEVSDTNVPVDPNITAPKPASELDLSTLGMKTGDVPVPAEPLPQDQDLSALEKVADVGLGTVETASALGWGAMSWPAAQLIRHSAVAGQKIQQKLGIVSPKTKQQQEEMGNQIADYIQTFGGLATPRTISGNASVGLVGDIIEPISDLAHWAAQGVNPESSPNLHNALATVTEFGIFAALPKIKKSVGRLSRSAMKLRKLKGKAREIAEAKLAKDQAALVAKAEAAIAEEGLGKVYERAENNLNEMVKEATISGEKDLAGRFAEQRDAISRQRALQAQLAKAKVPRPVVDPGKPAVGQAKKGKPAKLAKDILEERRIERETFVEARELVKQEEAQVSKDTANQKVYQIETEPGTPEAVKQIVPERDLDPSQVTRNNLVVAQRNALKKQLDSAKQPLEQPVIEVPEAVSPISEQGLAEGPFGKITSDPNKFIKESVTPEPVVKPEALRAPQEAVQARLKELGTKTEPAAPAAVPKAIEPVIEPVEAPIKELKPVAEKTVAEILTEQGKEKDVTERPKTLQENVSSIYDGLRLSLKEPKADIKSVHSKNLSNQQKGVQKLWKEVFDKDVVFFETGNKKVNRVRGLVDNKNPNLIMLNKNSSRPALHVAAHELTHTLETSHPEIFSWMKKNLDEIIKEPGYKKFLDEKKHYSKRGKDPAKEFYPEMMSEVFGREDFWNKLLDKDKPKALKVMSWLNKVINNIKNFARKEGLESYFKDVDKVVDVMADVHMKAFGELSPQKSLLDSLSKKEKRAQKRAERLAEVEATQPQPKKVKYTKTELEEGVPETQRFYEQIKAETGFASVTIDELQARTGLELKALQKILSKGERNGDVSFILEDAQTTPAENFAGVRKDGKIYTKVQIKNDLTKTSKRAEKLAEKKVIDNAVDAIMAKMNDLFQDEGGWIDIGKRQKIKKTLNENEFQTIRNLGKAASDAGMTLKEFLDTKGFEKKEAQRLQELWDVTRTERPNKIIDTPPSDLVGGIEKPTELYEVKPGETITNPARVAEGKVPISSKWYNAAKKLEKTQTPWVAKTFKTSLNKFSELGGPFKEIWHRSRDARKLISEETKVAKEHIGDLVDTFPSKKLREEAGIQGLNNTKNGPEALRQMGVKVKEGTAQYQGLLDSLEPLFEDMFVRLNETRRSIGKREIPKMEKYLPFFTHETFLDQIGKTVKGEKLSQSPVNLVTDGLDAISHRHSQGAVQATRFAHLKRGKLGTGKKLELDPLKMYAKYLNTSLKHIHNSPINAFVKELTTKRLNDPKFVPELDPTTGKMTKDPGYKMTYDNPEAAEFLGQWSNSIAGVPNVKLPKTLDRAIRKMNSNFTTAMLGYSARTMLVQPTALLATGVEFGAKNTMQGVTEMMQRKPAPISKSRELGPRVHDAFLMDTVSKLTGGPTAKAWGLIKEKSLSGMSYIDYLAAEATWRTAYNSVKNKMTEREAIRFADDTVVRTQGAGDPGAVSPAQMNSLGRAATLWQTFTINQANFIARDVLGIKNPDLSNAQTMGRVVKFVAGAGLMNTLFQEGLGIQGPFPSPVHAIQEGLDNGDPNSVVALNTLLEMTEALPLGSSVKFGSHPLGPVVEYLGEVSNVISGNDIIEKNVLPNALEGDKKSIIKLGEMIGQGLGIPGTRQITKFVKARDRGEGVLGSVIGRYEPKEKKVQSSRRSRRRKRRR